jgi:hypothetical protein
VPIVVFNPLRERALERFVAPQDPVEMATFGETRIASEHCQVRIGGDVAALKGVMKLVLETHDEAVRNGAEPVLDLDFIANHTHGFEAFADDLRRTSWDDILRASGLPREQLERVAAVYICARRYRRLRHGDHPTSARHRKCAADGEFAAAARKFRQAWSPVRGHSNVQGDRTVGVDEKPKPAFLDQLEKVFGFEPPRAPGHHVVNAVRWWMGAPRSFIARRQFRQSGSGLARGRGGGAAAQADGRGHHEAQSRPSGPWPTGADPSLSGAQRHRHAGGRTPVRHRRRQHVYGACVVRSRRTSGEHLKSEVAIVGGMAKATLPNCGIDWDFLSPTTIGSATKSRRSFRTYLPSSINESASRVAFTSPILHVSGFGIPPRAAPISWSSRGQRGRCGLRPGHA